ncbi:MAG: hypothetical protein V1914_01695 [archaeon]
MKYSLSPTENTFEYVFPSSFSDPYSSVILLFCLVMIAFVFFVVCVIVSSISVVNSSLSLL